MYPENVHSQNAHFALTDSHCAFTEAGICNMHSLLLLLLLNIQTQLAIYTCSTYSYSPLHVGRYFFCILNGGRRLICTDARGLEIEL